VDENFKIKGLITATDIVQNYGNGNASKDKKGRLLVGAAIGVREGFMDRVDSLVKAEVDVLVVDIAHGHSDNAINTIKAIKKKYPNVEVIGGNVATAQGALDLINAGADGIKVGIGSGSVALSPLSRS
ncbi:MAG: IMP dehydrogenase, partial [Nitrospirae bacterium]|nr:IMP dehydrogenase [Nitrospirota bacterium]